MRAWATSISNSLVRLASVIGPLLVGALLDAKLGLGSVFLMFAAAAFLGLIVMASLGLETKQRALEERSDSFSTPLSMRTTGAPPPHGNSCAVWVGLPETRAPGAPTDRSEERALETIPVAGN